MLNFYQVNFEEYQIVKIVDKFMRQVLKKYASIVKKLIEIYGVEFYLKDSAGFISKIYPTDDIFHLIGNKNHLDGTVLNLVQGIDIKDMNVCIDIGANLGFVSASLSKKCKQVISFEPEPKNVLRIKDLIKINNIENVEVVQKAVADKSGKLKFYTSPAHAHHSLGLAHGSQSIDSFIEVDVVTLDEFCHSRKIDAIDCLKIDVEGFEYEVFQGAKELFKNKKIKNVIFEISHGVMRNLKKDTKVIFDFLKEHGFVIYTSSGKKLAYEEVMNFSGQDLIAKLVF